MATREEARAWLKQAISSGSASSFSDDPLSAPTSFQEFLRFQGSTNQTWTPLCAIRVRANAFNVPRGNGYAYSRGDQAAELVATADLGFQAEGLFTTVNPILPDLASKLTPHTWVSTQSGDSVKNTEILSRKLIMIDFDPVKPDKSISANKAESFAAQVVACHAYIDLAVLGIEQSLAYAFSGNGSHLYLSVDLPNNDESSALVKRLLDALGTLYGSSSVIVDSSVANAARLCPIYGTVKRKGGHNPEQDRLHRKTFFCSPANVTRLSASDLEAVLAKLAASMTIEQTLEYARRLEAKEGKAKASPTSFSSSGNNGPSVFDIINALPIVEVGRALGMDTEHPVCPDPACANSGDSSTSFLEEYNTFKCLHHTCGEMSTNCVGLIGRVYLGVPSVAGNKALTKKLTQWAVDHFQIEVPKLNREPTKTVIFEPFDSDNDSVLFVDAVELAPRTVPVPVPASAPIEARSETSVRVPAPPPVQVAPRPQAPAAPPVQVAPPPDRRTRPCTDLGNAERFVDMFGIDVRYIVEWEKWAVWSGKRWAVDHREALRRLAQKTVRSIYGEAKTEEDIEARRTLAAWAKASESSNRTKGLLEQAQALLYVNANVFDTNPWLLSCQNGTLDLRTGTLSPSKREDYITKISPSTYDPKAKCPVFDSFLADVQPDPEVRSYLARRHGYALTGVVREHMIGIDYGPKGRNGKGTFTRIISKVQGSSAVAVPKNLLLAKRGEVHPTELATLHGARYAHASETARGDVVDTAMIKNLTGGDEVSCRKMREDFWSYMPTHKLFLQTQHKPRIRDNTDGMWERLHILPWLRSFTGEKQDTELGDKLGQEMSGVLNWLVQGCLEWQTIGLSPPKIVTDAMEEYRMEEDLIGQFIAECLVVDPKAKISNEALREAYDTWCLLRGDDVRLGGKAFFQEIEEHGFSKCAPFWAGKTVRGYAGLKVALGVAPSKTPRSDDEIHEEINRHVANMPVAVNGPRLVPAPVPVAVRSIQEIVDDPEPVPEWVKAGMSMDEWANAYVDAL